MLPGFDAAPLKREFKRLMNRVLPAFAVSLLNAQNAAQARSALGLGAGSDIASAATVDLTTRTGKIVRLSGTTGPITAVTMANGDEVIVIAESTPTFNVSGVLSYQCAAGDAILFVQDLDGVQTATVFKKGQAPVFTESPFNLTASVGSSALTITLAKGGWFFRDSTLGTGGFTYVKTDSDLTLTISSGSTLGTTSGVQSDVMVRVANDAGTLRLTAENAAGGMDASETGVISTTAEGGAGAADSSTTIYSASAITSKAYRVAGLVRSTQATAGTWATSPSLVQGAGGVVAIPQTSMVRLYGANGYGSTNTRFRRFTTIATNKGSDITYADSSTLGASFTINTPAVYSMSYSDQFSSADAANITVNDTSPTGNPVAGEVLASSQSSGTNASCCAAWTGYLPQGAVIRARSTSGTAAGATAFYNVFTIARVS